jgi:hypothetical protein
VDNSRKSDGVVGLRLMRWLRLIGWLRWEGLRGEKSENRAIFLFWVNLPQNTQKAQKKEGKI